MKTESSVQISGGKISMTAVVRKRGWLRLTVTIIALTIFVGYLFDFVAPRSFLASYYSSFRSTLFSGTFGAEQILYSLILIFTGFIFFLVPFYFGLLLSCSFGEVSLIATNFSPLVSILIAAKNHEKEIGNTLDCLLKSNYPKDKMEIIVITSGSTDGTTEIARARASKGRVRVLDMALQRKGKPVALNLGLASAKGELIAIYDADTVTTPETIRHITAPFSESEVSAVTGPIQVLNEDENKLTKGTALENTFYSGAGLLYEIRERLGQGLNLMGRNYCIRKDLLKSLGGFEETSLTEDFSLMFKLKEQGKRIAFSPKAVASDIVPSKWNVFSTQRKRWATGWNEENKKYMASTTNKRKAALSMINFLIQGNLAIFTLIAIVFALIFWGLGDYLVTVASLLTVIFTVALMAVAVHKYGNKKYSLLAYFPVFIFISLFMFKCAALKPQKGLEWNKTPTE
jgi:cellulose synthase/poly-beta-1,6-N-acetylglucosamine synthase-like glycosyltransferase